MGPRQKWVGRVAYGAVIVAGPAWALAGAASTTEDFEPPPDEAVTTLLPATLAAGENYRIVDPVHSDGLMHRYAIESRYGRFDAYGRSELELRVHEVMALNQLATISKLDVIAGGAGHRAVADVNTVTRVATHPVRTVRLIPKGIAHLFQGYVEQGKEAAADARQGMSGSTGTDQNHRALEKAETAVRRYAERYFGLTDAERRWYQKLGVDPYTGNTVLRKAIHEDAQLDATANFGARFIGVPRIAGLGIAERALDAVDHEDPALIRARQRDTLIGYGLSTQEIDRFHNTLVMSPTRQVMLFNATQSLDGVAGRGELFRHATGLTSDAEAQVYVNSVSLLVIVHHQQPLQSVLADVRLPAARLADGRLIVCGAFDAVSWTQDVAEGDRQLRESLPVDGVTARDLYLGGSVSARARAELEQRGWQIHENLGATQAPAPST